jgi:hypothetical protein
MASPARTATRTAVRTALASALVATAVGLAAPAQHAPAATPTAHTGPAGVLHTVAVPTGADPAERALAARATEAFSMVGITWDDPYAQLSGTAEVRTRSSASGKWSGWHALDADARTPEAGPDHTGRGLRAGTQPLWTGASDGVQARITGAHGTALPQGLRVELVDPNGGTSSRTAMSNTAAEATAAGQPPITSRAAWGADESIVADPPTYTTDTKAVFVHHTAGTNDYTCAASASIIRGILTYHVKSNGWNDIGYNFLVDKCGTLFEGRAGGVDKPVYGAHTYGFNTDTSGIAVLGDYNTATTTPVVRESIAKLAAWKLGLYGINPSGTVVMAAGADNGKFTAGQLVTMNRISGHRDGYPTECPGNNLYADLPAIRTLATDVNSPSLAGDYNRDGHADLAAGIPQATVGGFAGAGQVSVVPGARSGPYAAARTALTQDSAGVPDASEAGDAFGAATAYGDLDHDGYADLIVGAPGEERTDDATDEGALTVFRGNPNGLAAEATSISPKQSGDRFGAALATGDFDGDGSADILAVAAGSGRAYAVDGADRTLSAPAVLAEGPIQDTDIATGDFDYDGYTDAALTFRTETGSSLAVLRGSAEGLRTADLSVLAGAGGRSVAAGDLNGDGYADLAVGRPDARNGGEIATYHGSADGLTTTGAPVLGQSTPGVPGGAEEGDGLGSSVAIGDTDGDGYADVLAGLPGENLTVGGVDQADAGAVLLLHGSPTGLTATDSATYNTDQTGVPGAAEAADRLGSAVALADFTGDGYADLGIGSDGENGPDGTVLTLNSGPTGVTPASGLYFGPTTLGATAGSHIGDVLAR